MIRQQIAARLRKWGDVPRNLFTSVLTYRERLSLAWQLTWPVVLVDLATAFVLHVMFDVHTQGAELISEFPNLLIVTPWIVRRMVARRYPGFELQVLRDGQPARMNYTESFKVMWLLSWRVMIPMLALLMVVSPFLGALNVQLSSLVPTAAEAPFLNAAGLTLVLNTAGLFLMPLVMPGMFNKRYQGFRVIAKRVQAQTPTSPAPRRPVPAKRKK